MFGFTQCWMDQTEQKLHFCCIYGSGISFWLVELGTLQFSSFLDFQFQVVAS